MAGEPSSRVRVVLVEDHLPTRDTIADLLRSHGERIELTAAVADGPACLRHVERTNVDVALLDLRLPLMGGCELIRRLSQRAAQPRCLALTTLADEKSVIDALRAGARGYLLKDEPAERVVTAVEEVHRGAHPVSSRVAGFLFARARRAPVATPLSDRESELADLLAEGFTYAECSQRMSIGVGTVQDYVKRLYRKLDVNSRSEVRAWVAQYREAGEG